MQVPYTFQLRHKENVAMSLEDGLPCSLGMPVFLSLDMRRKTDLTCFLASPTAPETGQIKPDPGAFVNQVSAGLWGAVAEAGTTLGTW